MLGLSFIDNELSKKTSILGLRRWVLIAVVGGAIIVLIVFLSCLCICCRSRRRSHRRQKPTKLLHRRKSPKLLHTHVPVTPVVPNLEQKNYGQQELQEIVPDMATRSHTPEVQIQVEKAENKVLLYSDRTPLRGESTASVGGGPTPPPPPPPLPEASHLGWLQRYTMEEIEVATRGLCDENMIGEGENGIVYRRVLEDHTVVAVKNLLNNSGQAEKEFQVEVAVLGLVKHKNLVRLLGYCAERTYRMLVYEYVENGNLDDWLHGHVGVSPLTWNIRVNIILGTAKGYSI